MASVLTEAERIANVGKEVTLKKLGPVVVHELYLEDVIKLGSVLVELFDKLDLSSMTDDSEGLRWLSGLVGNPQLFDATCKLAAAATGREPVDFQQMPLSDWLKLAVTLRNVLDWEELRELFFQLVPVNVLERYAKKTA